VYEHMKKKSINQRTFMFAMW